MKRITALLLAILFCLSVFGSACTTPGGNQKNDDDDGKNEGKPKPSAQITQNGLEDPTLIEIANEVLLSALTGNAFSYHQFVVNDSSFNIDPEDIPTGWGEFSYESHLKGIEENNEMAEKLGKIDRDSLSEYDKIVYDNFMEALTLTNDLADYYYYDEPLAPFNGEHTMLPLLMPMYEIRNKKDAEGYLALIEDMPRYLGLLEQFEKEKSEHGLFMTENALDQVIDTCRKYADEGDDFFLVSSFEETIDNVDSISAEDKAAFKQRNRSLITESVLPAYTHLADTLESLRPTCRPFTGACSRSNAEKRYFELNIRNESAVDLSCDEMAELLDDLAGDLYDKMFEIVYSDYSSILQYGADKTSGDHDEDIEYLLELIDGIYPEIPDQTIDFRDIPDALADDFSPAAYLISAFDDPSRNVVIFNPSADQHTMLFTLAHECFPGHLYQTQYFRANKNLCLAQQAITPSGYSEGWAVFSEFFIAGHAEMYNTNTCLIEKYEGIVTNILIPGYVSIKINHDGWTKADVKEYLSAYSIDSNDYVDIIYEYAVDVPLYFFNYAMGFTNMMRIYNTYNPKNDAEIAEFLAQYLSYGPCYFDILNEKFNVK